MGRFEEAMRAIDALHAEDPTTVEVEAARVPAELVYARGMSAALARLAPDASEELRLAVRAQHLQRWSVPRDAYPEGRAGYHRWRTEQARRHAELAAGVLEGCGYDAASIERVRDLIRKKDVRSDPEAQALEDAACLVFLEQHLASFAVGREEAQLAEILQKTWRKMSERARAMALTLPLDEPVRALVARALTA